MNIYRMNYLILLLLFYFEDILKKNKKLYSLLKKISIFNLILLVTFRGKIGPDTENYIDHFNGLKNLDFEKGFILLNKIVSIFTKNPVVLFFIISCFCFISLHKFINQYSDYYYLSLTFYFSRWMFLRDLNQIRFGIACSFLYLAFIALEKNKNKWFYLYILCGSFFHKTIIFCLIFPLFKKIFEKYEKKIKNIIIFFIVIFPFINMKEIISPIVLKIFPNKIGYITGMYSVRNSYISVIFSYFFLLILIIFQKKIEKKYKEIKFLEKIYIFSCLITSIFFQYGDLSGRLSAYFNIEFVILDKYIKIFKNKNLIKIIIILFLLLLYYINVTLRLEEKYLPYFLTII